MDDSIFVGLDVHKATISVAVAEERVAVKSASWGSSQSHRSDREA